MRKFKKSILFIPLIIFIIIVLGAIPSFAKLTVTKSTTISAILKELGKPDGYITGITDKIRDQHPNIYCTNQHLALNKNAQYKFADGDNRAAYPGDGSNNGYAKAYVLAASGYVKSDTSYGVPNQSDERQWAWYYMQGTTTKANDLVNIALAYQEYKESEQKIEITGADKAKATTSGDTKIYGPIQIKYSYNSFSGKSKSDEWGGFSYAFFNEAGTNINNKVKLCILQADNTYREISENQINGYYKVESSDYSNVNLYIITTDDTLKRATMRLQENTTDYFATVYNLYGEFDVNESGYNLCTNCRHEFDNMTIVKSPAVGDSSKLYESNGRYYRYSSTDDEKEIVENVTEKKYDQILLGGTILKGPESNKISSWTNYKLPDGSWTTSAETANSVWNMYRQVITDDDGKILGTKCLYCQKMHEPFANHGASITYRTYEIARHRFVEYTPGCHKKFPGSKAPWECGIPYNPGDYESQSLLLMDTSSEVKSNEIAFDFDVEFFTSVDVKKVWLDNNNAYSTRPGEIQVRLLANGAPCKNADGTDKIMKLNSSNKWKGTFAELPINDENNNEIIYTVEEMTDVTPNGYIQIGITGNQHDGYFINNMLKTEVTVTKVWDDDFAGIANSDNLDDLRTVSVKAKLFADGKDTGKTITLNQSNNWTNKFTDLYKCNSDGSAIKYTVQEVQVPYDYEVTYSEPAEDSQGKISIVMTNTHEPYYDGYIEIRGKVWLDKADGKANKINGTMDDDESGLSGIKVTLKDVNGNQFDATSTSTTNKNGTYTIKVNYDNRYNVYKLYQDVTEVKEKLKTAYVEFEYDAIKYTTVATATTGANTSKAKEDETGRNKFDNTHTTVTTTTSHPDKMSDNKIIALTKGVISFETYTDKTSRKVNEPVKYCECPNGKYEHTNTQYAWGDIITEKDKNKIHTCGSKIVKVDVETIQNVNLGLFEREQPKVGIFSDLSKVEVEMNKQKYTYLYGVRSDKLAEKGMKAQFQNKDEWTYQRPVNPADIAYIQEETNKDAMSVLVTYEIELANLSTTLPITVQNIINVYDLGYNSPTITYNGKNVEYTNSNIYGSKEERGFNEITLNNLGITIMPQQRSSKIQITYKVTEDEILGLFNGNSSLHNAVEIHTYSTTYGEKTLYAEQRTGGRTGKPYAGYDYEVHPGNAAIRKETVTYTDKDGKEYQAEILKSTKNLVDYKSLDGTTRKGPERDTDIAPSFILFKDVDNHKILAGTVFEDNAVTTDGQRLGDGKYDRATEKTVENVKVELFKVNSDGTSVLANLYKEDGTTIPAVTYSDSQGNYSFGSNEEKYGVVTGEYFIKFTYGNDTEKIQEDGKKELANATKINGVDVEVNARNYKSTIITNPLIKEILKLDYKNEGFDKNWHINIEDNYSIAVDNMKDRLEIKDLQNSNFYSGENMTAYSKPFMTQLEFNTTGQSKVDSDGKVAENNTLSKLDFGIIERPREDIFIQKRVTHLKITLANGQVLTEGNPSTQTLNYVKSMGQGQIFENSAAARDFERRILVEMDTELIQGSKLEVGYEVVVKNNNEIDYDYGTIEDYADITGNNYITTNSKAKYYYYGIKDGLQEMKTTIEIVDYLSNDVVYNEPDEGEIIVWEEKTAKELKDNGLIDSEHTYKALEEGKNYRIFKLASNDGKITLARGASSEMFTMSASKLLANKDENIYDNHVEIIKIDAKSARTIGTSEEGTVIEKTYIPGDYVPTLDSDFFEKQNKQQDDDKVPVILTNSTGITNYMITYLVTGLIGLIVLVIGVVMIKKVSTKNKK